METLNSSHRPFKIQNAVVNSLSGDCDYYRVTLDSDYRIGALNDPPSSQVEAIFDMGRLLSNIRANLNDGEWSVYLEYFQLRGFTQWPLFDSTNNGLHVCLPDLIGNSKNYIAKDNGLQIDDSLQFVSSELKPTLTPSINLKATITTNGSVGLVGTLPAKKARILFTDADGNMAQFLKVGHTINLYGAFVADDATTVPDPPTAEEAVAELFLNGLSHTITSVNLANKTATIDYNPTDAGGNPVTNDVTNATPLKVEYYLPQGSQVNYFAAVNKQKFGYSDLEQVFEHRHDVQHTGVGRSVNMNALAQGNLKVVLRGENHKTVKGTVLGNETYLSNHYPSFFKQAVNIKSYDYRMALVFVHKNKSKAY